MFLTCKLLKVDPSWEVRSKLHDILSRSRRGYTYHMRETLDGSFELNFYIGSVMPYNEGKIVEVYYEDFISLRQISKETTEEGEESFSLREVFQKIAYGPFYLSLFEKEPLQNYVGILAGNRVSSKISSILSRQISKELDREIYPLRSAKILVEKKQKEIREIHDFYDVVELIVENIADQYVNWAWVKGTMLDQSEEYYKFVESPMRGIIKTLAIRFRGRIYYLYSDGRIFTREADLSSDIKRTIELGYFYEIARRLKEVEALV